MRIFLFLFICVCFSFEASAQEEPDTQQIGESRLERFKKRIDDAPKKNFISLSVENDNIGGGTDQYYTSGVRLTYFNVNTPVPKGVDKAAEAVPTFDLNKTTSTFFTLGQNLYTPQDITRKEADPDDRPWAAWLYGTVGLATLTEQHLDELELTLGVVGPEALGEQTQKFVHRHISGSDLPKGWSNQLEFEPGLILSWQRRWPSLYMFQNDFIMLGVTPNVNVSLGNIYTYAGTGVGITLSPSHEAIIDTPPRVRPAQAGSGFFETPAGGLLPGFTWQVFASVDGRAMGRNIFLDGNTFEDSPSVDKRYFVYDAAAGISFIIKDYRLSYSYNFRSKEFDGQDDHTKFGSVTLSTRF